jgi:CheY-specific phosphatase CheX
MMERPSLESASRPALPELVTEVLGNLAFMVTDDHDARPPSEIAWLACEVNYYGPHAGALRCWCTRPFATALAANLLGIEADEEDARAAAEDALREFMNVLCGQLVTAWYGTTATYNLTIPIVQECLELPAFVQKRHADIHRLSVNQEPFFCLHEQAETL